jgi:hypothetical protein
VFGSILVRRVKSLPSPLTGEGAGGGARQPRLDIDCLPPIPSFPRQGGRGTHAVRQPRAGQYWGRKSMRYYAFISGAPLPERLSVA